MKQRSRILALLLVLALIFSISPVTALAVDTADDTLTYSEVDLSEMTLSDMYQQLVEKGVDAASTLTKSADVEKVYVETVAKMLTEQLGVVGLDDVADSETVNVFVWLQELPDALDRVYKADGMSIMGYAAADSKADTARTTIKGLAGGGMSRGASLVNIAYEYSEVFSGFALEASKAVIDMLAELPGVYLITEIGTMQHNYTLDPGNNTLGNSAARDVLDMSYIHDPDGLNITGAGVNVGVIDSGIDATHPDLVGAYKGGYNFTNDKYTGKSSNMSRPESDHGTHVSGTIASQGIYSLGMAPGVNLYMAQVFTADRPNSASTADVLAAIESFTKGDPAKGFPKMDVVNMSLGAPVNTAYDPESYAINNGVIAGVNFALSAGNEAFPDDDMSQRNPYTIGSPSATSLAVTVAASKYGGYKDFIYNASIGAGVNIELYVENDDHTTDVFGNNVINVDALTFIEGKGYEMYYACGSAGDMTADELTALKALPDGALAGKVLVVNRGQAFLDYGNQALRLGAGALIVINRDEEFIGNLDIGSSIASKDLAIFTAKVSSRQKLLDQIAGGAKAYLAPVELKKEHQAKEPASFSSIGPVTETAEIKPDVIAPGWDILSTAVIVNYPDPNTSIYNINSGTSMSTPCVAGLLALLKQKYPTESPIELKARLMNTANPNLLDPSSSNVTSNDLAYFNAEGTEISVFEQGAGFVDPLRALTENVYITVDNIIPTGAVDEGTMASKMSNFSFGIADAGSTTAALTATVYGASNYTVSVVYNNDTRYSPSSEGIVTVKYDITGNTFKVWLDIDKDASSDPIEGNLYEGYIIVTANGKDYVLPWAVRVGDAPSADVDDWLLFPTRPIQATYNHANQEWSPYSSQNYLYFMFDGDELADSVVLRRSGTTYYLDILLFNVNNPEVPAYRYQVSLGTSSNANLKLSDIIYADGRVYSVASAARAYARNTNGTWATTVSNIAAGSYFLGLQFSEAQGTYYNYYYQLGITFSNTRPTLTINNASTNATSNDMGSVTLAANSSTYSVYDYKAETYTVSGKIFSSAIDQASKAGPSGFYWAGHYLLNYGVIIPVDQALNVLEDNGLGGYFVEDPEYGPWICDEEGNFELTFNTPTNKYNAYLLNYNTNASTGLIDWVTNGSRHSLIPVDAFDVTQANATQYGTIGNLTGFTWTPYVRQGDPILIDVLAGDNGTATITGDGMYAPKELVTIEAIADEGYYFTGWYVDGELGSLDNPYTFAASVNCTVEAAFELIVVVDTSVSAAVTKQNGNKNLLTITVVEYLSDGNKNIITASIEISNNAAGKYKVGEYTVYVDTKGNTQIRECYFVN